MQPKRTGHSIREEDTLGLGSISQREVPDEHWGLGLLPLPVRVRYFRHETPLSYEIRLAAANHLSIADLRAGCGLSSHESTFARVYPANYLIKLAALGGIRGQVISNEANVAIERPMCPQCSHGERVRIRDPFTGYACVKHAYWTYQNDMARFQPIPEVIDAERQLRSLLASGRKNLLGTTMYRFAQELAFAALTAEQLSARMEQLGTRNHHVCLYPETVSFVDLLSRPAFLRAISTAYNRRRVRYRAIEALKLPEGSAHGRVQLFGRLKSFSDTFDWKPNSIWVH